MQVTAEHPDEMNLLGLIMRAALQDRVEHVARAGIRGDLAITAGEMSVTISFSPQSVVVRKGLVGCPRAHLRSSLESLIEIAQGRLAGPLLRRRARVSGNPLALLPLARVFRSSRGNSP